MDGHFAGIYGMDQMADSSMLDIVLVPSCWEDNVECKHTLEETQQYIENGDLLLIHNEERLDLNSYDKPIIREAVVHNQQFNVTMPSFKYLYM
jgi:hypothetical protein